MSNSEQNWGHQIELLEQRVSGEIGGLRSSLKHLKEDRLSPLENRVDSNAEILQSTNEAKVKQGEAFKNMLEQLKELKAWKTKAITAIIATLFMLLLQAIGLIWLMSRAP